MGVRVNRRAGGRARLQRRLAGSPPPAAQGGGAFRQTILVGDATPAGSNLPLRHIQVPGRSP
jgi:hypothetical protein